MSDDVDNFISNLLDDLKHNRLRLPTLPQVATKIINTIDDPSSTNKEVTRICGTDAALSAKLIQTANSAMYRTTTPAEDMQAAITRLGLKQVRNIASSLLIKQLFNTKFAGLKKRLEKLWTHSAHVAAISAVFAKKHTKLRVDEVLLAGLVHDIGHLPIYTYAENFPEIAKDEAKLNAIAEKLGPVLGKTMLQAWKFAPAITTVVAEHENLKRFHEGAADLCDIVQLANLHSYIGTQHRLAKVNWSDIPAFEKLKLTPEESINALKEAHEDIQEIRKLLTV